MPESVRQKYGYDPRKAAEFAAADAAEQEQAQAGAAEQRRIASARQHEQDLVTASHLEAARMAAANAPQYTSSLDAPAQRRDPVNGTVIQIVDSGMLIAVGRDKIVLLEGYPKQDTVIDKAKCVALASLIGSYEYDTVGGSSSRIARYRYISGTVTNPR